MPPSSMPHVAFLSRARKLLDQAETFCRKDIHHLFIPVKFELFPSLDKEGWLRDQERFREATLARADGREAQAR